MRAGTRERQQRVWRGQRGGGGTRVKRGTKERSGFALGGGRTFQLGRVGERGWRHLLLAPAVVLFDAPHTLGLGCDRLLRRREGGGEERGEVSARRTASFFFPVCCFLFFVFCFFFFPKSVRCVR